MGRYLDPHRVSIEMGLETADPWKLRYCVNKAAGIEEVATAAKLISHIGASSTAYILVGVPFLTLTEMVDDSVDSAEWALNHGIDYAVLFPVHIKPWTVVHWLHEHNLYPRASLWSLAEALTRFPPEMLGRIGISWHAPRPDRIHPAYSEPDVVPTTCPVCYDRVLSIFDTYRFSADRGQVVESLQQIDCDCKAAWRLGLETVPDRTLSQRVKDAYRQMGENILGKEWWALHGVDVIANVTDHA